MAKNGVSSTEISNRFDLSRTLLFVFVLLTKKQEDLELTTMMLLRQRGEDTEYYYGEGDVSWGFMGDNGSVKSDDGDKE